jgi:hypothetical protein
MSTVQNVGSVPPLPPIGPSAGAENRAPQTVPGVRSGRAEGSSAADQIRTQTAEAARAAEKSRAKEARDEIKVTEPRQLATKSGLVDGSFTPFVDIIDPRYQTKIARIFGPDGGATAAELAPDLVPSVVSKAYAAIEGAGNTAALRKSA